MVGMVTSGSSLGALAPYGWYYLIQVVSLLHPELLIFLYFFFSILIYYLYSVLPVYRPEESTSSLRVLVVAGN